MKKVFEVIKKIVVSLVVTVFFIFAVIMAILLINYNDYGVSQFGNTSLILVKEDTSADYKKGDLVVVESKRIDKYNKGDELFIYKVVDKNVEIEIGKLNKIYENEKELGFENGSVYDIKFIAGTPTKVYSGVGNFLSIVESKMGFLFIILVPSFLIFVYEIYALIIEFKYGSED